MADIAQHQKGERIEAKHACPDCPTPLTALWQPPRPACRFCGGTGLVTTSELARWQHGKLLEESGL